MFIGRKESLNGKKSLQRTKSEITGAATRRPAYMEYAHGVSYNGSATALENLIKRSDVADFHDRPEILKYSCQVQDNLVGMG